MTLALIQVVWTATAGTIAPTSDTTARYTAPANATGTALVIASVGDSADTAVITFTAPSVARGLPYGPFSRTTALSPFTVVAGPVSPSAIVSTLEAAKQAKIRIIPVLTGGAHRNYLDASGQFDLDLWRKKLLTFDTPAIRQAIAACVSDGTCVGTVMIDEPHHHSWGVGAFTKPLLDQMANEMRALFPTLPIGVTVRPDWRTGETFRRLDFVVYQYARFNFGPDAGAFRELGLRQAVKDNVAVLWSLNLLDGGTKITGCPTPETGGPGTFGGNCRMTPAQVQSDGLALGPSGCGLLGWRYEADMMGDPGYRAAFQAVRDSLDRVAYRACR